MNAARLFAIGGSLLLLNAMAVLTSGVWRHVVADELPRAGQASTLTSEPSVETGAASTVETEAQSTTGAAEDAGDSPLLDKRMNHPADTTVHGASPASATASPLDRIPIPESLPTVPSLADHESLKDDPGFQEFSRLFSKVEESWETDYPSSVKPRAMLHSADYFEALDKRLHSAEQLCAVARSIAAEAARQSINGRSKQSEELLQMATQLRDMAAKLLVVEL